MSKTNLEKISPTNFEMAEVSWESTPGTPHQKMSVEEDHMRNLFKKIRNIWDEVEPVIVIPTAWQMQIDVIIPPDSWADADSTIIPFWAGMKPQKKPWWKKFSNWLSS